MEVTVAVATFGERSWIDLAEQRAIPSAEALGVPVVHTHADTLHDARNAALDQVDTEWVCHLDADDELEHGYFTAMANATADLRAPRVRYLRNMFEQSCGFPKVAGHGHDCDADCLTDGNWLVIGTVARADMVRAVGGWRDFPWSEDWDLWLRCYLAGATVEPVRGAVYRAHVRRSSRNRALGPDERRAAHCAIAEANGLPIPA